MDHRGEQEAMIARLLADTGAGDRDAFARLHERVSGLVASTVAAVEGDPARRSELTDEVFVDIWRRAGRAADSTTSTLFVLERVCAALERRPLVRPRPLGAALLQLACPDREYLLLAAGCRHSHAVIAALTGTTETHVRTRLCRALAGLAGLQEPRTAA